jgi:hypothetical protein
VPVPEALSLASLNEWLVAGCIANRSRTISGHSETIGENRLKERPHLAALAAEGFTRGRGAPGRFRLPEWHFVPRIFMKGGIGGKNRQCYRRARDLVAGHSGLSTPSDVFSQIDRQNFERMYRIFRDRFKSGRVLESVRAAATNSCVWRPSSKSLIPINQGSVFRRSP